MTVHAEEIRLPPECCFGESRARMDPDDLARKAKVSRAAIVYIESGVSDNDVRPSTVADVAAALETSPMILFVGEADVEALI